MDKKNKSNIQKRPIWTGNLTIGLVNLPVKLYSMIDDKGVSFRFLHKVDGHPLKYQKVCTKDERIIPWQEVAKGYEIAKNEYVIFNKEELDVVKPESDRRIRIEKFVDYYSVDPLYFSKSYILMPDKSNDAYSLMLQALTKKGKAAAGRITLRTKEYPALVHAYRDSLVLTTLRYAYDVMDPEDFEELKDLREPEKKELELALKIIADLSGEFDINEYEDRYRKRVLELVKKKMKGEKIKVEKPVTEEVKGLMVALRETLKQLENK